MDFRMSKFDIDRIACLMYRDIAAYIDDQRKQSSDCDAAVRRRRSKMRLNNATIKQVIVSPATLGERLRLCGIRPYNEYIDGNRTDTVLGYTYTVTCSGFQGERLDVKIPGKQLLGEDAYDHLVKFTNIQLGIYPSYMKGQRGIDAVNLKAMAEGVTVISG